MSAPAGTFITAFGRQKQLRVLLTRAGMDLVGWPGYQRFLSCAAWSRRVTQRKHCLCKTTGSFDQDTSPDWFFAPYSVVNAAADAMKHYADREFRRISND
jgi:hypothetical protein